MSTPRSSRPRRVTIADIAQAAGVSRPTVSRALTDHPEVGAETRDRIRHLARTMGYTPSRTASGLRTGRFHALGLVVPAYQLWWSEAVLRGAAEEAARLDHTLLLHVVAPGADGAEHLAERFLPLTPIDGVVLVVPDTVSDYQQRLDTFDIPVVLIDDRVDRPAFPTVRGSNAQGAVLATEHLLSLGRRDIALAAGPPALAYTVDRHRGYRQALERAGLAYRGELVVHGGILVEDGQAAVERLLAAGVRFDAFFACTDYVAIGAMRALRRAGLRVPDDVAVIGFDDIPSAEYADPPLTTVRQPFYDIGATAVRRLVASVQNGSAPHRRPEIDMLDVTLVVRESCGTQLPGDTP